MHYLKAIFSKYYQLKALYGRGNSFNASSNTLTAS